ncbi:MAG TPA: HD domain-containing protein [Stellaceae bacterium]|jgi:hypothetical protein|nr:HD domain-containing protein [Stellaceae bacterium]
MVADNEVVTALGGPEAVTRMDHEARADALEHFMAGKLEADIKAKSSGKASPSVAELDALIDTRGYRRGIGNLFIHARSNKKPNADETGLKVKRLAPMPEKPTLVDFFEKRFNPASHMLQSAALARRRGTSEEVVMACLLHDIGVSLLRCDHGYWSAQLVEPYVSEKVAFAVRYHQPLRFFADPAYDYEYPQNYYQTFGFDYVPPPHVLDAYNYARNHKWYEEARLVTINDLYAFDPNVVVHIDEFRELIGRHFRQPKEGLGYDNSPVAHMWRTMINPDQAL